MRNFCAARSGVVFFVWLPLRMQSIHSCENTRAAWQLFFTARTWAKPHRFDSSVTLLLRRVVQSKTQWHSNVLKLLKLLQKSSQASKTFFQLLQIKRLQLKLTNNLQNSYQISSQHQVPKTWVKQHPKTPKTQKQTKIHLQALPCTNWFHLVPNWFLQVPMGSIVHRSVPTNLQWFPTCSHAHAMFQDRFKDVQVGSRWFSTLYILSPNFHTPSWTVVLYTEVPIDYHIVCKATKFWTHTTKIQTFPTKIHAQQLS